MPLASFTAKLYFLSTGNRASWGAATDGVAEGAAPSDLTEIPNIADFTIPLNKIKTDVTTRLAGGVKAYYGTLKDMETTIPQVYDSTDTGWLALQKAWLVDGAIIALAMLDGDKATTGTQGLWGDFTVLDGQLGQKIDGVQMWDWKVAPGWTTVPIEWIKVTA